MSKILSVIDVNDYGIQSMVGGGSANLQEKTATPTTSQQIIEPDTGYDGMSSVTVGAVTSSIDSNIIPTNIRSGVTVLGVQGNLEPDKPDQTKTVNPSTSQQVVMADTGYELASVTVNAMNLQSKDVSISTNGTTTITADSGYDGLSDVDVTVSGVLDTSDATAVAGDMASGKTAYVNGSKITGNVFDYGTNSWSPAYPLTITNSGAGKVAHVINFTNSSAMFRKTGKIDVYTNFADTASAIGLTAGKLKKDEVVLGITGTYEGIDTSDATATAPDIAYGETAYVKGVKITGSTATQTGTAQRNVTNQNDIKINAFDKFCMKLSFSTRAELFKKYSAIELQANLNLIATAIELTANKLKKNEVVCGITGTYEGSQLTVSDSATPDMQNPPIKFNDITSLNLGNANFSAFTYLCNMCAGCVSLTDFTFDSIDLSSCIDISNAFYDCPLTKASVKKVIKMCCAVDNTNYVGIKTLYEVCPDGVQYYSEIEQEDPTLIQQFESLGWSSGY